MPAPGPDLDQLPTLIDVGDRSVRLLSIMRHPRVVLVAEFLDSRECEELVEHARSRLGRSMVRATNDTSSDDGLVAYVRTSQQASFPPGDNALVDRVYSRVSTFMQWPITHMENVQVVRYAAGAEFTPHHDYFSSSAHSNLIEEGGQRVATVLVYLNTASNGGATMFCDVELEIMPHQGHALAFSYPCASAGSLTLHAGVPLAAGEKWIASFFLRDRPLARADIHAQEAPSA